MFIQIWYPALVLLVNVAAFIFQLCLGIHFIDQLSIVKICVSRTLFLTFLSLTGIHKDEAIKSVQVLFVNFETHQNLVQRSLFRFSGNTPRFKPFYPRKYYCFKI